MSFYISIKGTLNKHEFAYLSKDCGRRLDPTVISGKTIPKEEISKRVINSFARNIMNLNPVTLSPNDTVAKAISLLQRKEIHHIPIVSNSKLMGMISDRDISWVQKSGLNDGAKLEKFMSDLVVASDDETPIDHIAKVLYKEHLNGIPIIDSKHNLIGIVTHHDILKWLFEQK
jgi:acetoin utilization protein AcuB